MTHSGSRRNASSVGTSRFLSDLLGRCRLPSWRPTAGGESVTPSLGGPGVAHRDSLPELVGLQRLGLIRVGMRPGVGAPHFRIGLLGSYRLPWSRPAAGGWSATLGRLGFGVRRGDLRACPFRRTSASTRRAKARRRCAGYPANARVMRTTLDRAMGVAMCMNDDLKPSPPNPDVLDILDDFWEMFLKNRSLCGYLPTSAIGMRRLMPGGYYDQATPYEAIIFKESVTVESRAAHNAVATWNNENFVLRLWAILESNGFTKPIREGAARADYVRLLKRLRQHFGHGSGRLDLSKSDHRRIHRDLTSLFPDLDSEERIPLSIDTVLEPLFLRCREYAAAVLHLADAPVQQGVEQERQQVD